MLVLHRRQFFKTGIPYWVFINGHPVGIMQSRDVSIEMLHGTYSIGIKLVLGAGRWHIDIGSEETMTIGEGQALHIHISDRERWWNVLFDIDLVLWALFAFVTLPAPWNMVYHILSEGFFAIWMARTWLIRKHYFVLEQRTETSDAGMQV